MRIEKLIEYIKKSSVKADNNVSTTFGSFLKDFESQLKSAAPVDSGAFKEAWSSSGRQSSGGDLTASISNNSAYAGAIEFGSLPGSKPWPSPGEKTVMSGGRIYSSQAVGGTLDKVFNEVKFMEFAEAIADSILRAFK